MDALDPEVELEGRVDPEALPVELWVPDPGALPVPPRATNPPRLGVGEGLGEREEEGVRVMAPEAD